MTDIHTHDDDVDDTQVIQLHLDSENDESASSDSPSTTTGFVFLFFDRTIEEGQQFLLYAYPRAAQTTTRILSMQGVLSALEGAMSGVTGQKVEIATFVESSDPLHSPNAAPGPLHIKVCSREVGEPTVGLAFICLQWSLTSSQLMSDLDLIGMSVNVLSSLRLCIGSLRLTSFQMQNSPKTAQQQHVTFEQMSDASFSLIRSMISDNQVNIIPSPVAAASPAGIDAEVPSPAAAKFVPRCTAASSIVFDAFFDRLSHTVCRDITSASDTLYRPIVNSPPPLSRILDAKERECYQRSKRAALHTAHSAFLSPSYVPTDLPPSALSFTPDPVRTIDREIGSLLQQLSPADANARQRLALPVLGALVYHHGGLVHVAHSPTALSQLTRFNSSSPAASSPVSPVPSLASPRRPQFLSSLQFQANEWSSNTDANVPLLRKQDVHEITNFITLLGLSRRSKANRGEYISPRSPQSPPLQYAGTHQLYFSYASTEVTPRDFGKARGAYASPSWSGSDSTLDAMASPLNLDMIPTTRANSEDEKAPHYTLTAINHSSSTTSSSVAFSPSSSMKKSNSESNLAMHASTDTQPAKSDASKKPTTNLTVDPSQLTPTNQILQTRTVTVLQLGRNSPSEEKDEAEGSTDLILVLVQDASDAPQQHGSPVCDDATFSGLCLPATFRSIFTRSDCVLPLYQTLLKMYAQLKIPQHLSSLHSDNPTGRLWSLQSLADSMTQRVVPPSPPLHQRSHTSAAILSSSLRIDANAMAAADSQLTYEFMMLDTHRGVLVRSVSTASSQLPSLPVSFEMDFLQLTRKIHKTFRTFKHLFINTSTAAYNATTTGTGNVTSQGSIPTPSGSTSSHIPPVPSSTISVASSPTGSPPHTRSMSLNPLMLNLQLGTSSSMNYVDPHASAESLGKGNHLYFRRHKTMETVRLVQFEMNNVTHD